MLQQHNKNASVQEYHPPVKTCELANQFLYMTSELNKVHHQVINFNKAAKAAAILVGTTSSLPQTAQYNMTKTKIYFLIS